LPSRDIMAVALAPHYSDEALHGEGVEGGYDATLDRKKASARQELRHEVELDAAASCQHVKTAFDVSTANPRRSSTLAKRGGFKYYMCTIHSRSVDTAFPWRDTPYHSSNFPISRPMVRAAVPARDVEASTMDAQGGGGHNRPVGPSTDVAQTHKHETNACVRRRNCRARGARYAEQCRNKEASSRGVS